MAHNPQKNKALCVIAKITCRTLAILTWCLCGMAGAILVFGFGLAIAGADWATLPSRVWNEVKPALIITGVYAGVAAFVFGLNYIYAKAKNYAKDC